MLPWPVWQLILEYANNWQLRGVCRKFRNFRYRFDIGDFTPLCKRGTIEILKQYLQQFPRQRFNIGSAVALRIDVVELFSTILPGVFWLEETFIRASAYGNLPLVKLLCKKFKKVKFRKYGYFKEQALERACRYEQYEIINYLLKKQQLLHILLRAFAASEI